MRFYQISFSPTGGVKKVLDFFCSAWKEDWETVDLARQDFDAASFSFLPGDLCVIAVPSYGGRVPQTAARRLSLLNGNGARAVLMAVYGNRAYEDTLLELKNTARKAGFLPGAAISAVAEHSILRRFAAGRPDTEDAACLRRFAREVQKSLSDGRFSSDVSVPGNFPYKEFHVVPLCPRADETCTGCGLCARECPAGAIPVDSPDTVLESRCISCMRCVAVCPAHARSLPASQLAALSAKLEKACSVYRPNELFL